MKGGILFRCLGLVPVLERTRFVHSERATIEFLAVPEFDGLGSLFRSGHLDEPETA